MLRNESMRLLPRRSGKIAARRTVQPFRARGRQRHEGRFIDQRAIEQRDAIGDLDRGGITRMAIDRL
jgi:hypothetical protein